MKIKRQILISLVIISSGLKMNAQWNGTVTASNVGIGTNLPSTKLEIVGSSQVGFELGTFKLKSSTTGQFMYLGYDDNYSAGYIQSVKPGIGQQNILLAPSGGNVGIGVNIPDRKLTVAGIIGVNNGGVVFNNGKVWDISSNGNNLSFNETGLQTPLFIQAGGNIGVNTNSPSTKLEIVGSSQVGHELGTFKLKSSTAGQFMYLGYDDNYSAGYIQSVKPGIGQQNILLAPSGGNVGIGTTTPYQQLSITGGIGFANHNSTDKKLFSPIDGTLEWLTHDSATEHAFAVSHQGERRVYLNTKGHSYFIGGNVGIGTTTPGYKLDVCGTIRAKEVKVDLLGTCVPDFVFKKDYKLMNLNELEKFVTTKQHLPEIAPEKEMIENGLNMKEFQMKLLQKMEEMTLYIIEQNKKNEKQDQELKMLKAKIKKMNSIKR